MTVITKTNPMSYAVSTPAGRGFLRPDMNYLQRLESWLSKAGSSEFGSSSNAVELCLRCVRERDSSLNLPPGKLISLPPLPEHIEQLHAPSNRIRILPDLKFWPLRLQKVYLPGNRLRKVEGGNLPPSITTLDVSSNVIKKLIGPFPGSLHSIIGSNNFLEELPIDWPENLQELILQNCRLHFFPDGLPDTVHTVDVSGNPIEEILREDVPLNLQRLSLARTGIVAIPDALPSGLLDLDVSGNQFDYFDGDIYQPKSVPKGLRSVDLKGCNITTPPRFLKKLSTAATVDLRNNPLSEEGCRKADGMAALVTSGPRLKFTKTPRPLVHEVGSWLEEGAGHAPHPHQVQEWRLIQAEPGKRRQMQALSGFLGRLRQTDIYQDVQCRPSFVERVHHVICGIQDNDLLRQRCMQLASEQVAADDDQLIATLADMETEQARWKNEHGEKTQVIYLDTRDDYREACLDPQPNTTYHYHDIACGNNELTFTTDSLGRAINSSGQLRIAKQKQRFNDDNMLGFPHNPDALPGDIGFHAGANQFGFPGGALNVFPGNSKLNSSTGDYGRYENEILRPLISRGKNVNAQFIRKFNEDNHASRPDAIHIVCKVDGEPQVTRTFVNFSETDDAD